MMKSSRMSWQWWKGFAFLRHKTSNFFLASLHRFIFSVSLWLFPLDFNIFFCSALCVVCCCCRSKENSCEVVAVECRFVLIACAWAIYSRPQDTITTRQHTQQPNNEEEDEVFSKNILSYLRCGFHCLVMMRARQWFGWNGRSSVSILGISMAELRFILIALITFTVKSSTNELNGTWVEKYFRMENVNVFRVSGVL